MPSVHCKPPSFQNCPNLSSKRRTLLNSSSCETRILRAIAFALIRMFTSSIDSREIVAMAIDNVWPED